MPESRSVVVIGGGTAGSACARKLAREGWDVTVVESDRLGGLCLWRGCVPKKALYQCAAVMRTVQQAEQYGIGACEPSADWQGVLAWKWHSEVSYAGDQRGILDDAGAKVIEGAARFIEPNVLQVDDTRLTADHFVIATGSEPILPDIPGIELADTSDQLLRIDDVPESLAIVGSGYVGMEMAGIFASFGTRVTVVSRSDRVLEMLDPELADVAARRLSSMGVRFITGATVTALSGSRGQIDLILTSEDAEATLSSERVLMAVGRRPLVDGLNLEVAGVMLDQRGHIVVDQFQRTTRPEIFACGDASGGMMQTPIANLEGRAVAESLLTGHPVHPDCSCVPVACFTLPQLATVGLTEEQARAQGHDVRVLRSSGSTVAATIITAETDSFAKIVADAKSGRILGAQIAGSSASDLVYTIGMAMKGSLTVDQLGEVPAIHPSFSELVYFAG